MSDKLSKSLHLKKSFFSLNASLAEFRFYAQIYFMSALKTMFHFLLMSSVDLENSEVKMNLVSLQEI